MLTLIKQITFFIIDFEWYLTNQKIRKLEISEISF